MASREQELHLLIQTFISVFHFIRQKIRDYHEQRNHPVGPADTLNHLT
jgi:hypothetical protein